MTEQRARISPPDGSSRAEYSRVAVLVLLVLLLVDVPRLQDELRFVRPGTLIAADGSAPVLQDDADDPAVDAAFGAAAARLPAGATCVIARHAWHRDYFRAAYLLMPRRVWPAAGDPTAPITPGALKAAVAAHHADCVLSTPGLAAPAGFREVAGGAYALYVASDAARPRG